MNWQNGSTQGLKVWVSLTATGKACFQLGLSPSTRPIVTHIRASREACTEKEGHRNWGRSPGWSPREKENDVLKNTIEKLLPISVHFSMSTAGGNGRGGKYWRGANLQVAQVLYQFHPLHSKEWLFRREGAEDMAMLLDARTRFSSKPLPQWELLPV